MRLQTHKCTNVNIEESKLKNAVQTIWDQSLSKSVQLYTALGEEGVGGLYGVWMGRRGGGGLSRWNWLHREWERTRHRKRDKGKQMRWSGHSMWWKQKNKKAAARWRQSPIGQSDFLMVLIASEGKVQMKPSVPLPPWPWAQWPLSPWPQSFDLCDL